MSFPNWQLQPGTVFSASPVMPVVVIKNIEHAIPIATALFEGGISVIEVTLRTPIAFEAIQRLTNTFPDTLIGAGTVTNPEQLKQAMECGAKFAISPGQTHALLMAGRNATIPFIPGISSVSELMECLTWGYDHCKFFPAAAAGGIPMLRSIYGPFPNVNFCPTGGINEENYSDYLALPNVSCVGGSWLVPEEAITKGNWSLITELAKSVRKELNRV